MPTHPSRAKEARDALDDLIIKPQKREYDEWNDKLENAISKIRNLIEERLNKKKELNSREYYVIGRVKDWDSLQVKIEESRIRSWDTCKDLLAFKIVVLSRDNVLIAQSAVNRIVIPDSWNNWAWHSTYGRGRGYQARHMQLDITTQDVPEPLKEFGAELQILTEFQQTWDKLTHDEFYKTKEGVPTEGRNKVYRLAAMIDLLDEELVLIKNRTKDLRKKISIQFSANNDAWKTTEIDEFTLVKASQEQLYITFKRIRNIARECGYKVSAWDEMVRCGMETDCFVALCTDLNVETFQSLDQYINKIEYYIPQLKKLVEIVQSREEGGKEQAYLFDRPLMIISIVMMLAHPSFASRTFKPEIVFDIQKLAHSD